MVNPDWSDLPARVAWDVTPLSTVATGIGRYLIGTIGGVAAARPGWDIACIAVAEQPGIDEVRRQLASLPTNVRVHPTVRSPAWATRRIATATGRPRLERFADGPVGAFIDSEWFRPHQQSGVRLSIVYDLIPLLHPEWVSSRTRKAHLRSLAAIKDRADSIIAISEVTKRDLVEHLGIPPSRIAVAYPGVGREYRGAVPQAPASVGARLYVVVVGTTNARKNLVRMLEAFAVVARDRAELDLVVVGAPDVDELAIGSEVARLGIAHRVHRLGYVSDSELAGIVAASRLLVFPSLYEGFGMPVVEAQAAGVPVAASANPSLDEACGDAAERFDPLDVGEMAQAMGRALDDPVLREMLIARGRANAAQFTWEAAGEAIAAVIESAIASRA